MYRNILVPVAFDEDRDPETAMAVARALKGSDGHITLLHVMEETPPFAINYIPADHMRSLRESLQEELAAMAGRLGDASGVLVEGHAGRTILEWAKENEVDCIVVASHKPGLSDYFLGSTAQHVVRHAPCAVHVLR